MPSGHGPGRLLIALLMALLVATLNIGLWYLANRPHGPSDWHGQVSGFAFSPFRRYQSPLTGRYPDDSEILADLRLLSRHSDRIRTYAALENPQIPRLAKAVGMRVTAGAWLNGDDAHNAAELQALISMAADYPQTITQVIVGNEVLLRHDMSPNELMAWLDRARAAIRQPVSTAEPWHIWHKYPELARHVDYITVHLLPYWEGVARKDAIGDVLQRYDALRQMFPYKRILVGEIGWPSNGDRFEYAKPSTSNEAIFLRQWLNVARARGIDYFLMEAFDQPWKEGLGEGRVGAYWGMYDADRTLKFPLTGPVVEDASWPWKAGAASLLALLPMFLFAWHFTRFRAAGRWFFLVLIQLAAGVVVWSATLPFNFYLGAVDWTMLALLFPAQIAIIAILLINGFEFTEVLWHKRWLRHFELREPEPEADQPFVSVHLACYNEPPDMVIATLDSLAALDYARFEVLVIDNNTRDPEVWQPVQAYCEQLGPRFRFFHLEPWPGFKAGALNYGLEQTDARADVVAVVDADYVVRPDWLSRLAGYFHQPDVGVVQCPQAHRDFQDNAFRRMTAWEYDGFFRIGMHHRNERNAIIQHGTMTMVRRSALDGCGGWSEWTICEDAELGLRLMHAGYKLLYVDELMGKGLTPSDFTAYKSQRWRWAFGGMQVLKGRWSWLVRRGPLSAGQRFHFLTGWFSWFADALHLVFTLMAIYWTAGMIGLPRLFALPMMLFLIPALGFFIAKAGLGIVLYRARVPCGWRDTLRAAIASMGLSHAIARGILAGLVKKHGTFVVTSKKRRMGGRASTFAPAREELLLAIALGIAIIGMALRFGGTYLEGLLWIAILSAQSLPYLSALATVWIARKAGEAESEAEAEAAPAAEPQPASP